MAVASSNDDGTYNLAPDDGSDEWFGVTPGELSADDATHWPAIYARLCSTPAGLSRADFGAALKAIGITISDAKLDESWTREAPDLASLLDVDDAYELVTGWGMAAVSFTRPAPTRLILYWNDTRMGGRDPGELEPIGIADTLAILGLTGAPETATELDAFEATHGITVPAPLRALWTKQGVLDAIKASHCNNPEPQPPSAWTVERTADTIAIRIMLPHQGDHAWWAVFPAGGSDAQIKFSFAEGRPPVRLVAESLAFFFHDLASTGRCWAAHHA